MGSIKKVRIKMTSMEFAFKKAGINVEEVVENLRKGESEEKE